LPPRDRHPPRHPRAEYLAARAWYSGNAHSLGGNIQALFTSVRYPAVGLVGPARRCSWHHRRLW